MPPQLSLPDPWLVGAITAVTAVIALLATRANIQIARRLGHVVPVDDWHSEPVALSGGVALVLATLPAGFFAAWHAPELWPLLVGSLAMGALGLWDDTRPLSPQVRLVLQALAGVIMALFGIQFSLRPELLPLNIAITAFWFVGLTNAFNIIDNMDGMLPGSAAIAAAFAGVLAYSSGYLGSAILSFAIAAGCLAFLRYNLAPAKIFLGDVGSLYLGFMLAGLALLGTRAHISSLLYVFLIPSLLLLVPIFNVVFVIISRATSGTPILAGRADHINYRLLAHGFSGRRAVFTVHMLSAVAGLLAVVQAQVDSVALLTLAALFFIVLCYAGVFLYEGRVTRYQELFGMKAPSPRENLPLFRTLFIGLMIGGDLLLLGIAFLTAILLRFDGVVPYEQFTHAALVLPLMVTVRLAALLILGAYSHVWRFLGRADVIRAIVAVLAGTVAAFLLVYWGPATGLSRSVLLLDLVMAAGLLTAVRLLPRGLLEMVRVHLTSSAADRERVLIVGAGEAGRAVLREIETNPQWRYQPVGLLDDDRAKIGRRLRGVKILGSLDEASEIAGRHGVKHVILAIPSAANERVEELARGLQEAGCACEIFRFELRPLVIDSHVMRVVSA